MSEAQSWYAVRCLFKWPRHGSYEERVTIWMAADFDDAVALAEEEAGRYATDNDYEYLRLAQCYRMPGSPLQGAEVFSLLRDSDLEGEAYLDHYFDTGSERQGSIGEA